MRQNGVGGTTRSSVTSVTVFRQKWAPVPRADGYIHQHDNGVNTPRR